MNTLIHPRELHWHTVAIGVATIVLIVALERTRPRGDGIVVAVVATSALVPLLGWSNVATLTT